MAADEEIANEDRTKVYLETSFFSYLTGRETPVELIAPRQNSTCLWWRDESVKYNLFISQHITTEAADGSPDGAVKRLAPCRGLKMLEGSTDEVDRLEKALLAAHAVPNTEVTDAYHIATAANDLGISYLDYCVREVSNDGITR